MLFIISFPSCFSFLFYIISNISFLSTELCIRCLNQYLNYFRFQLYISNRCPSLRVKKKRRLLFVFSYSSLQSQKNQRGQCQCHRQWTESSRTEKPVVSLSSHRWAGRPVMSCQHRQWGRQTSGQRLSPMGQRSPRLSWSSQIRLISHLSEKYCR